MVGIYCSKNFIRFSRPSKTGEIVSKEYSLGGDDVDQAMATVESIFKTAQKDLGFAVAEDFRLLVDFPLCQSVAQMVPFVESQLPQVLENYLEEELPNDIEDYAFDFQVLDSKGGSSSILAFWIRRSLLEEWTELANEWSLNSLDIQPAEMAMVKDSLDESCLQFQKDPLGRVRFCSLLQREQLPHLTLGMFKDNDSPENILRVIKFSLTDLSDVKKCLVHSELLNIELIKGAVNCESYEEVDSSLYADCFMEYSLKNPNNKQLDYRKGEFAQRGIEEKVLIPAILLFIALLSCIGAFAWKNYKLNEAEEKRKAAFIGQKKVNWEKLYKNREIPYPKNTTSNKKLKQELMRNSGMRSEDSANSKSSDQNFSSLQTLGQLFLFIEQDKEVLITRAAINNKSITLTGTTSEQDRAYKLKALFKNNATFEMPDVKASKVKKLIPSKDKGMPPEEKIHYKFTFKTSLREDE